MWDHPNFYMGVSVPNILETKIYEGNEGILNEIRSTKNYYFMGGALLPLSEYVQFSPSILLTYNPNVPVSVDMNASFILFNALWVGGTWRVGDSFDAMVQYQISNQFKLGVAYDFTLSDLRQYTDGTLEIMADYMMVYEKTKLYNLRYF